MMYYDFEAQGKSYRLRMNTRSVVQLEKKIGCNPISIFGANGDSIPTIGVMVDILHASLQQYEHGITEQEAMNIFDSWLEEGHTIIDFVPILLEIYKVSGLIAEKN